MSSSNTIFAIRCGIALLLAIQLWVWLRFAGALWVSDSLSLMETLFKSVSSMKIALKGFAIWILPVVVASFIIPKRLPLTTHLLLTASLGVVISCACLVSIALMNISFIKQQFWVYVLAGGFSGLVYGAIVGFPIGERSSSKPEPANTQTRRKVLGSVGLFAGAAALFGSFTGPFYFWKERGTFIDVNLADLEDGQMVVTKLANRPVWIIKRSPEVIDILMRKNERLRDPNSEFSDQPSLAKNRLRSIRPEYFVVSGLCTHLGCLPTYIPEGDENVSNSEPVFFCPCHGGVFDLAGRVYNGTPPPVNMVVPTHEYVSESIVRLYFPSLGEEWKG